MAVTMPTWVRKRRTLRLPDPKTKVTADGWIQYSFFDGQTVLEKDGVWMDDSGQIQIKIERRDISPWVVIGLVSTIQGILIDIIKDGEAE